MPRDVERRVLTSKVEYRDKAEGGGTLAGYAALYDTISEDLGGFREVLRPGCFDRAIRENQDVLARAEHDSRMLLGRSSSGTLRLSLDSRGLKYEIDVPDTAAGRDTMTLVKRGDVSQSSFAFCVPNPDCVEWIIAEDGAALRQVLDLDLVDVAPVALPAYSETTVSARALEQARSVKPEQREEPSETQAEASPAEDPAPVEAVAEAPADAAATQEDTEARMAMNRNRLRMEAQ